MKIFSRFWQTHPLLLCGLSVLCATAAALSLPALFVSLFLLLLFSSGNTRLIVFSLLLFLFAYFSTPLRSPPINLTSAQGKGQFHISSIKKHASPFHHSFLFQGRFLSFHTSDNEVYADLPCHFYFPLNQRLPIRTTDWIIEGTLSQKQPFQFVLKPTKDQPWTPVENTHSFALLRHALKEKIKTQIQHAIPEKKVTTFLSALVTGDTDEKLLSMEFGKIGLQHILAISGFHFALIALFFHTLFRWSLPHFLRLYALLLVMTGYYFFLGDAPSIQRAYLMIVFVLLGKLLDRQILPLNLLGLALCIEVMMRPIVIIDLSFQLTFLCTLAILLLYAPLEKGLRKLLPKRFFAVTITFSLIERHAIVLTTLLRKSLAVNLAVTLFSLPVLLHLFHRFPLLGLAYNLFVPACVSLSLFLLCLALLLPFLSSWIHAINHLWTALILQIVSNPPATLDFVLRTSSLRLIPLICLLTATFLIAIYFHEKERLAQRSTI